MGYTNITLHGNQICDYLYIASSVTNTNFQQVKSEPEWNDNTLLLAKFNGDLKAGNEDILGNLKGYEVRRVNKSGSNSDYVGFISEESEKENYFIVDYAAKNNTDIVYHFHPLVESNGAEILLPPTVIDDVKSDWGYWSLMVVDETDRDNVFYLNKVFKFELNLETGDMSNNAGSNIIHNFTKYPYVQHSTQNYWSGSLTALTGYLLCGNAEYIQTVDIIEDFKNLSSDTRRKFLKDMVGNIWEVEITSPVDISTDDRLIQRLKTVKVSWAEIAPTNGISITNNPEATTVSWVLTDDGIAVPYMDYIWDNDSVWNNSQIWTDNNVLTNVTTNKGRDISV